MTGQVIQSLEPALLTWRRWLLSLIIAIVAMKWILLTQLMSTLFMVGLIWFVQVVHYPLFRVVGRESFPEYEKLHQRLTSWVVGPVMLLELFSAGALVVWASEASVGMAWAGLLLLGLIWLSTWRLQMPAHQLLRNGFEMTVQRRLVSTNWIRTLAWSARGIIVLIMTARVLP